MKLTRPARGSPTERSSGWGTGGGSDERSLRCSSLMGRYWLTHFARRAAQGPHPRRSRGWERSRSPAIPRPDSASRFETCRCARKPLQVKPLRDLRLIFRVFRKSSGLAAALGSPRNRRVDLTTERHGEPRRREFTRSGRSIVAKNRLTDRTFALLID